MPNENKPQTFAEFKESFLISKVAEIAQACSAKKAVDENGKEVTIPPKAPFLRDLRAEEMPRAYNALNGIPYEGLNSLSLDIKRAQMGYQGNTWVSLTDAQKMAHSGKEAYDNTAKEIEKIKENWKEKSVKIQYIQTTEVKPKYQLDDNGEKIPLLDENGNQRMSKGGEPLFRYEVDVNKPIKNAQGQQVKNAQGEPMYEIQMERIQLKEPKFRTELLYNIEEFHSINLAKVKDINKELERKHNLSHAKGFEEQGRVVFEDIKEKLHPNTANQIYEYLRAQALHTAYLVPRGLNANQMSQTQKIAQGATELSNEKKEELKNVDSKDSQKAYIDTAKESIREHTPKAKKEKEPEVKAQEAKNEVKATQKKAPAAKKGGRGR